MFLIKSKSTIQSKIKYSMLRYTLTGLERDYQIRIPSNQINKKMFYSTSSACEAKPQINLDLLNPYFFFNLYP